MKITVHSSRAVKPDYSGVSPPSPGDSIALSVFDKVTFDQYVSGLYFFHAPVPPTSALEAGFAKALAAYRVWAGRLAEDANGDHAILLNDAGALFVEATADVALGSVMPLEPTPEVTSLHPSRQNVEEPLRVQVTRFTCGSVVVGTTEYHRVGDGRTIVGFMVAWGQATRGVAIVPAPVLDRALPAFAPRDPPRVEFEHRAVEFKHHHGKEKVTTNSDDDLNAPDDGEVVVHRVRFSQEMIAELKSSALAGPPQHRQSHSTLQCVVAHLWRCITHARGLAPHEATAARIAVDGRARLCRHPRVPDGYVGNVVLWARPSAAAGELSRRPLWHAAELVADAVARVDDRYFRSFVDFASSGAVERERLVPASDAAVMVLSPDVEVYSMVGFPFCDADFGGGAVCCFHMRSYVPEEGLVFVLPSLSGDGSIYAYVNLFRRDVRRFIDCCYSQSQVVAATGARL